MAPTNKRPHRNKKSHSKKSNQVTSHSKKNIHCSTCNRSFVSMSTFLTHLEFDIYKKCLENYDHKCECCGKIFARNADLSKHYSSVSVCNDFKQNEGKLSGLISSSKRTKLVDKSLVYIDESNDTFSIHDDNYEDRFPANQPTSSNSKNNQNKVIGLKYTYLHNEKSHNKMEPTIKTKMNITDTTINELHNLQNINENTHMYNRHVANLVSDQQPQAIFDYHQTSTNKLFSNNHIDTFKSIAFNDFKDNTEQIDMIRMQQSIELERITTEYHRNFIREEELQDRFERLSTGSNASSDSFPTNVNETINENYDLNDHTTRNIVHNSTLSSTPFDATEIQNKMNNHLAKFNLSKEDTMCVDLFQMLRASNAPLGLYDKIITWISHHEHTIKHKFESTSFPSRERLINHLSSKVYYHPMLNRSKVSPLTLSSGRTTSVVTFSMRELILKTINNNSLFTKDNILLDVNDPQAPPPERDCYSDVNSGSWHLSALRNEECGIDKETGQRINNQKLLMPWTFFIDGLKTDKLGKITVEAVLACCLWFNKRTRNRSSAWNILGFVEDQKLFRNSNSYVRDEKAQDYHDMMTHIFSEFKAIRDNGGMKVRIDFSKYNGVNREYIIIPVIQFIIGDCKGNDLLCGRMAGHSLMMKGGCRDCDITPGNLDEIPLFDDNDPGSFALPCKFHDKTSIVGKTDTQLKSMSFLNIRNTFSQISFGGCNRSIWGATPLEILHAVQLGLCEYLSESLENFIFTAKPFDKVISVTATAIAKNSIRQSERDLPLLSPFRNGLGSIKSLKAAERFARVFCLYLTFANTYCIKELTTYPMMKENNRTLFTFDYLRGLFAAIEQLLIFHQWLKEDKYKKEHFMNGDDGSPSKALLRVISFMSIFKRFVTRSGNNLKTPKFHQILHITDYIKRFGAPSNWDGSRGEHHGKVLVKDNAKLTNRRKETLNYDISRRVYESNVMDDTCRIYFSKRDRWPSKYCNDTDLVNGYSDLNVHNVQEEPENHVRIYLNNARPCYFINAKKSDIDDSNQDDDFEIYIDWKKKGKTPLENIPIEVQRRLFNRLFTGSGHVGGKVVLTNNYTKIPCYTYVHVNDKIIRCHPFFGDKGAWYDWAMFHYDVDGSSKNIPGRLLMIIDLTNVTLTELDESFFSTEEDLTKIRTFQHLRKEPWVVIQSADVLDVNSLNERDAMFDSVILERVRIIEDDKLWLIPLSSIRDACCVILNNDYLSPIMDSGKHPTNNTGYIVKPLSKWGKLFLGD